MKKNKSAHADNLYRLDRMQRLYRQTVQTDCLYRQSVCVVSVQTDCTDYTDRLYRLPVQTVCLCSQCTDRLYRQIGRL